MMFNLSKFCLLYTEENADEDGKIQQIEEITGEEDIEGEDGIRGATDSLLRAPSIHCASPTSRPVSALNGFSFPCSVPS